MPKEFQRVVVTGLGALSPVGAGVSNFWEGLLVGRSGVRVLEEIDLSRCGVKIGAPISDYDPLSHFNKKELRRLSKASELGLVAAREAIDDAGIDFSTLDPYRVGVIMGSSIGGYSSVEDYYLRWFDGWRGSPFIIPRVMNNAPASNISIEFGLKGPMLTTDAACASAGHAVGYAMQQIRLGVMDVVITGGADAALSPGVMQAWWLMRALSERNDTPQTASRPFSKDRDGLVLGEGAGLLVLESEAHAKARGAHIYAEISGYGATADATHITQPAMEGPMAAMQMALRDAGLEHNQIDYINAHATATTWNDGNETSAIKNVFGDHAYQIPVVGVKGSIGHSIAATAALELISCVLSIRDHQVPPTINLFEPDPECDLDYVTEGARAVAVKHAMSNAFAFGGSNAVLIASAIQ